MITAENLKTIMTIKIQVCIAKLSQFVQKIQMIMILMTLKTLAEEMTIFQVWIAELYHHVQMILTGFQGWNAKNSTMPQ